MICRHCKSEVPVRAKGRGRKRTDWCDDKCKAAFRVAALKTGARVLRKNGEKKARKPRTNYRRQERELWGLSLL